jgi:K(+)-stimulated pyrophosphate-energized sodium pump
MNQIEWIVPVLGLLGLVVMIGKAIWVNKQDAGDENMVELAGHISRGALAFLRAEWRVLGVFVVIAAALLGWSAELEAVAAHTDWVIAIAFIIGAVFSAFAGWIGMNIATKANVRTTQAARTSLAKALSVSFTGGAVMGLGVAGGRFGSWHIVHCFHGHVHGCRPSPGGPCGLLLGCGIHCPLRPRRWRHLHQGR